MTRKRGGYRGGHHGGSSSRRANQPPRPRLTHFLCIPLVTETSRPQIENALARFRECIIESNATAPAPSVVPLSAIRPVDSIHLTLGVMSLETEERVQGAINLLQSLDLPKHLAAAESQESSDQKQSLKSSNLEVSLTGLETMHKVQDTSVLSVHPTDESNRLQNFCESLRKTFVDDGFIVDENRPLKLHATVLNTVYSKAEVGTVKRLQAEVLLELFKDFNWIVNLQLECIAICKMGAKKTFDAGGTLVKEAYEEVAAIPMPSANLAVPSS